MIFPYSNPGLVQLEILIPQNASIFMDRTGINIPLSWQSFDKTEIW